MLKFTKLFFLSLFFVSAQAHITILDAKQLDKIKNGTTYVIVKNLNFPGSKEYLEQMQKGWTLTKGIQFVAAGNFNVRVNPEDSFFSLESLTTRTAMSTGYVTNIYYYLSLWTCKDRFFNKERPLKQSDHDEIAKIALSVDPKAFNTNKFFETYDFDGGGMIYNWSPGMLKNYLQQLTLLLKEKEKVKIQDDITIEPELMALKNSTLYVADFNLIKFNPLIIRLGKKETQEDFFEDYKYPYKVVTKDELNKLIVNADKTLYYLVFIKDSSSKIVCVINAKTGQTIYSRAISISYVLKSGDLKDLYKEINRAK